MRVIIYDDGQILVKRKAYRKRILEYCKNNEVADKLLNNMLNMLKELELDYPKNIKIGGLK